MCGMVCRLRGRGSGKGRGKGKGRVQQGGGDRLPEPIELRGAARREQFSRDVEQACAREGGWNREGRYGEGLNPFPQPVPYWSWRPLCPGEWREGTGVSVEAPREGRIGVRVRGRASYAERMRVLAEASGTFDVLLNLGWGRYIGPRPTIPQRVEDTTGVT